MRKVGSKKTLEMALSKLKGFDNPNIKSEQYMTDADIAAEILWDMYLQGDLNTNLADFGCGTGILGIGAILLGCKTVVFIDEDQKALEILKINLKSIKKYIKKTQKIKIINSKVRDINKNEIIETTHIKTIIQNPPFGTKQKHADKEFLEKAFEIGEKIYSFHKSNTTNFVKTIAKDYGFKTSRTYNVIMRLKKTMKQHIKKNKYIEVTVVKLEKIYK